MSLLDPWKQKEQTNKVGFPFRFFFQNRFSVIEKSQNRVFLGARFWRGEQLPNADSAWSEARAKKSGIGCKN